MPNCWGVDTRSGSKGCRVPPEEVISEGLAAVGEWCFWRFCEDGFVFTCLDADGPSSCFGAESACNGEADWQNTRDNEAWNYHAYSRRCCVNPEVWGGIGCAKVFTAACFGAWGGRPVQGEQATAIFQNTPVPAGPSFTKEIPLKHLSCALPSRSFYPSCLDTRPCCWPKIFPDDPNCPRGGFGIGAGFPEGSRFELISCCDILSEDECATRGLSGGGWTSGAWHCCDRLTRCGSGDACCVRDSGCHQMTLEQCLGVGGQFHAGLSCSEVNCSDGFELECVQDRWVPALRPEEHANVGTYEFELGAFEVVSKVPVETIPPEDATLGRRCIQQYGRIESEVTEVGMFGARICNDYKDVAAGGESKNTVQECVVTFNDEGDAEFACGYRQAAFTG